MRKIAILLLTMLTVSTASIGQNGQYDVRLQFNNYDCDAQELLIDIDVKASSVDNAFRIAEQNYRFSFNASVIDDVRIVSEGTLSGYIEAEGELGYSSYSTHNIEGTLGNVVSYNIELTGGDGVLVDTAWVNVGTLAFHVFNPYDTFDLNWSTQSDFPPTVIIGNFENELFEVAGGMYTNDISIDSFIEVCAPCLEDIALTTQEQIDDFVINYPNCTHVWGDIKIGPESGSSSDITNLDGLNQIAYVDGLLEVSNNTALNSLAGLHNLNTVGGRVHISGNTILDDINAMEDTDLSGIVDLSIFDNPNLAMCDITSVCNYLQDLGEYTIYNNALGCESFDAIIAFCTYPLSCSDNTLTFTTQEQVDDFVANNLNCNIISGNVVINSSAISPITNLNGLNEITSIGGNLEISGNDSLANLTGLEQLTSIGGDLIIQDNLGLTSLTGLNNLTALNNRLDIRNNTTLDDISAIENTILSSISYLRIYNNPELSVCSITSICNYIQISQTASIGLNAPGCESYSELYDYCNFPVFCSDSILLFTTQIQIDDFVVNNPDCIEIFGDVIINSSTVFPITNLNGLNQITSIGGDLEISGNDSLANLTGLSQLTSIGGDVVIELNDMLSNLDGLHQLTSIGGDLTIQYNFGLTSLTGLDNLTALSNRLDIRGNTILDDISAIENANLLGISYLRIHSNSELSVCNITSVCNYIQISETASIGLNAPGCDSYLELYDYCNFPVFCSDTTLLFTTQIQIDDFAENNPDCTEILGNVIINSSTNFPINNLNGLNQITSIGGDLVIEENPMLPNLEGLNQLASIGGKMNIEHNSALLSLNGLDNLAIIGDSLNLYYNVFLNDISAIGNADLSGISYLRIRYNSNLAVCNIPSICGYLQVWEGGVIASNDPGCDSYAQVYDRCSFPVFCSDDSLIFTTQKQVDDFAMNNPDCTEIPGNVIINSSTFSPITNLNGLSQITSIGGDLTINSNPELESLTGLNNLIILGNTVNIYDNTALSDISAMEDADLSGVSSLSIYDNPNLSICGITSICNYIEASGDASIYSNASGCNSYIQVYDSCSFPVACSDDPLRFATQMQVDDFAINNPDCSTISGSIYIISSVNSPIINIDGLSQITSIGGDLIIEDNPALQNLDGLNQLVSVGSNLIIENNPELDSLNGLSEMTSVGGDLIIRQNDDLFNLEGLDNLTSLNGDLTIDDNFRLIYLDALNGMTSIGGNLTIRKNAVLTLEGLNQLTSIGGNLTVEGNNLLTSFSGLDNLTTIGDALEILNNWSLNDISAIEQVDLSNISFLSIQNNFVLSVCGITSICNYIQTSAAALIDSNGVGCESYVQVYDSCNFPISCSNTSLIFTSQTQIDSFAINNPNCIVIPGNVEIRGNIEPNSITNLDGLAQINSIGGNLKILYNTALTNLDGLSQLTSIGGDLDISGNSSITNLSGLHNLMSINGWLHIGFNDMLTSVGALSGLDYNTISVLGIVDNGMLSNCSNQMICNYLTNGGAYYLYNNAPGCNGSANQICGSLPVEMISPLSVRLENQNALLTWRTETETNNSGFEIQRSQDGVNWERIGWQAGQGTSTTSHAYTYVDENPHTGISYYRLKQVDFDGQFSYSNTVSLDYSRPQVNIFPNPVKDKLYIHTNDYNVDNVLMFNMMGQEISVQLSNNKIDVAHLPKGLYTIKVIMGEQYICEKIVVE